MYTEPPFMDRFGAAAQDGFAGVEFLFPYAFDASVIRATYVANLRWAPPT